MDLGKLALIRESIGIINRTPIPEINLLNSKDFETKIRKVHQFFLDIFNGKTFEQNAKEEVQAFLDANPVNALKTLYKMIKNKEFSKENQNSYLANIYCLLLSGFCHIMPKRDNVCEKYLEDGGLEVTFEELASDEFKSMIKEIKGDGLIYHSI